MSKRDRHEIVRVLDDRSVGSFRVEPSLSFLECGIAEEILQPVAREALRLGIARRRVRVTATPALGGRTLLDAAFGWLPSYLFSRRARLHAA